MIISTLTTIISTLNTIISTLTTIICTLTTIISTLNAALRALKSIINTLTTTVIRLHPGGSRGRADLAVCLCADAAGRTVCGTLLHLPQCPKGTHVLARTVGPSRY